MDTGIAKTAQNFTLRGGRAGDAEALGRICYEAFKTISDEHNFPPDFPAPEPAVAVVDMMLSRTDVYSVVAEDPDGRVVGSNFLWTPDEIAGVGPITIDPSSQNSAIGRALMTDVIRKADSENRPAVRLVQAAYHNRSLALYTKLGFNTVEPLSTIQGPALNLTIDGYNVRKMTTGDIDRVDELTRSVHGHSRRNEVLGAVEHGSASVVEHAGRITGYATLIGFFGHAVGESDRDLQALIGAAESFPGPGFLLPTRNSELMRWCLEQGLKIVQPMTLMSRGVYQEPRGAFLPSILF